MPTPLTDAINALTTYANTVTGASDTTLSDAVATLASGYGQGGGITWDALATNTEPSGAVTLSNAVTSIQQYAFAGKPITSITAPAVTQLASQALENTQIESITDDNFPVLGVSAQWILLLGMSSLKHIRLTGERIALSSGSSALRNNANIITAEFPNANKNVGASYRSMGTYAFGGCKKLELVDCGWVQNVSSTAFNGDTVLTTVILRRTDTITTLSGTGAFANTPFKSGGTGGTLYVPQDLISSYESATNWSTILGYANNSIQAIEGSQYETHYADGTPIPTE